MPRKLRYGALLFLSLLAFGFGLKWVQEWRLDAWRHQVYDAGLYADMYVWHRFEWPNGEPFLGDLLRRKEAFIVVESEEKAEKLLTLGPPPVDVRIDCDPATISERCRRQLESRLRASVVLTTSP
ncbi:hypothetical protein AYO47_05225 [Planctomyces sp. SCGC AG-212-M04]|nr:hypothetical protein AYO47_05225 [Planctomyces sp. SCGC AG-212-M04]